LLIIFGLITALAIIVSPNILDVPITRALQSIDNGLFGTLMIAISAPGFAPWSFIFPLLIIAVVALCRRFVEAGFLALATLVSGADSIVKDLVHRARPSGTLVHVVQNLPSYSFPSGHVTEYTLVFGFTFYLAFTLLKHGIIRTLILVLCGAMVVLVGPSRVWMGQHWASDALGGYTLGFGLLLIIIWAYRGWQERQVKEAPVAAH
jgi:membrane-associated phospholipid phosphatase